MIRYTFAFVAALCASLPLATEASPSVELSYDIEGGLIDESLQSLPSPPRGAHASRLLGLDSLHFASNGLAGHVKLNTLFARRKPLGVGNNEIKRAFGRLADSHRVEATLSARLSTPRSCSCKRGKGHHPHLGALGEVENVTPFLPRMARVHLELIPVRVLDRTGTADPVEGATIYEVIWEGQLSIEGGLEGRVELLRFLTSKGLAELELDDAFEAAIADMVCSSLELLDDPARLRRLGRRQAAPADALQAGFTEVLDPGARAQVMALTSSEKMSLRFARLRVSRGNLVVGRTLLAQLPQIAEVKRLQAELVVKQRALDSILAASSELREEGEPDVARRLIESYLDTIERSWDDSGTMRLEYARTLVAVGELELARAALAEGHRDDPSLETNPEFAELWLRTAP